LERVRVVGIEVTAWRCWTWARRSQLRCQTGRRRILRPRSATAKVQLLHAQPKRGLGHAEEGGGPAGALDDPGGLYEGIAQVLALVLFWR
jgi:hypothetical protein